ncbi:MAG: PolC-type DNA polymerase III, partial [Butyrivibrio sp.]|nr:PolC-type DNA polymerase III [Butyrivibrio sp.]
MGKKFFEVFPGLKLDDRTQEIMEQTEVVKVSTTRKQDFIRIYISSNALIDKTDIYKTETGIKKQLFNGQDLTIKIYEKFSLSAQYTPQNLFDIYRESIEMELKDYDHMEYSLFRAANFEYPDDGNVVIQLENSVVGKKKAPDLIRVLSKIVNERCGLSVNISPEFVDTEKETKEPDYTDESVKMAKKLEDFEQKSEEKKKKAAEKKAEKAAEEKTQKNEEPQKSAAEGTKAGFSKGKWTPKRDFGGSYKRSDNPDVVFGRDFDDETMKLSDLIGELGEVTVHGKVTAYDQRDIRNEKSIMIFDITDFTDSITVKMFVKTEDVPDITKDIKPGA